MQNAAYGTPGNSTYINPFSPTPSAPTLPATINSSTAAPAVPISLPTAPTPSALPNATGTTAANAQAITGNATTPTGTVVNATTGAVVTPATTDTSTSSGGIMDTIKSYISSLSAPPSEAAQYSATYGITPEQAQQQQQQAQADLNTKNQAVKDAQGSVDALNAQINGLDYTSNTVIPNQDQTNVKGQGVTAAGLAPHTADEQRAILLQKAPLQLQLLTSQAALASAQGNASLAAGILQQANSHLDALFQAQVTDAKNNVDYKNNLLDKAFTYADNAQKQQIADQKATLASNTTQYNNYVNDVRTAATSATASGQGKLAAQLSTLAGQLDPTSKTFTADFQKANATLSTLQGQIAAKSSTATTTYSKPYVDSNGNYVQLSSTGEVKVINTAKDPTINSTGAMPYTSSYGSPTEYVNAVLSKQGVSYSSAQANTPPGTVSAIDNQTGQTVIIDAKDWNASSGAIRLQYTVIYNHLK
jgi:hypothetical protein